MTIPMTVKEFFDARAQEGRMLRGRTCKACHGTGVVSDFDPDCRLTGVCLQCNGTGRDVLP